MRILIDENEVTILDNQLYTWITWADGTIEKVQIDENNFFIIDE